MKEKIVLISTVKSKGRSYTGASHDEADQRLSALKARFPIHGKGQAGESPDQREAVSTTKSDRKIRWKMVLGVLVFLLACFWLFS